MNKKEWQSFEEKHQFLKLIAILATSQKYWIKKQWYKLFWKNTESLMNYKELNMSSTNQGDDTYNSKKGVVWIEKKIPKSLFGGKHLLENLLTFPSTIQ